MEEVLHVFLLSIAATALLHGVKPVAGDLPSQYIGCYKDDYNTRAMDPDSLYLNTMTLNVRQERCYNMSRTFFGVEYSYYCFCGESFDKHGQSTSCDSSCNGDLTQTCGGSFALSVYWVCPVGRYGRNCSLSCGNCQTSALYGSGCYFSGTCPTGCQPGWNGTACGPGDPCTTNNGGCQQICNSTASGATCRCSAGYTLNADGKNCSDINECSLGISGCSHTCTNTIGSYICSCPSGFELASNGKTCVDHNECTTNNGGCAQICNNTVGSFTCSCRAGYTLNSDGRSCQDVNECSTNNGGCEQICNNTAGSYFCSCLYGYTLNDDGKGCRAVGSSSTAGRHTSTSSSQFVRFTEPTTTNRNGCDVRGGGCEHICTDTPGSYRCDCRAGYILNSDGKSCQSVDPCSTNNGDCQQICVNDTSGGHKCYCSKGFTLNDDEKTCKPNTNCSDGKRDVMRDGNAIAATVVPSVIAGLSLLALLMLLCGRRLWQRDVGTQTEAASNYEALCIDDDRKNENKYAVVSSANRPLSSADVNKAGSGEADDGSGTVNGTTVAGGRLSDVVYDTINNQPNPSANDVSAEYATLDCQQYETVTSGDRTVGTLNQSSAEARDARDTDRPGYTPLKLFNTVESVYQGLKEN